MAWHGICGHSLLRHVWPWHDNIFLPFHCQADAHKIHYLMIVLVAFKSLTVLSQVRGRC